MNDNITKAIDSVMNPIIQAIAKIITTLISTRWSAILVGFIAVNIIGFVLMKKDKEYAQKEKWRVKESTLLATAAVGGSLGIYAGMYKYNHKTKHDKFTMLVPIIMLIQIAFASYGLFTLILK